MTPLHNVLPHASTRTEQSLPKTQNSVCLTPLHPPHTGQKTSLHTHAHIWNRPNTRTYPTKPWQSRQRTEDLSLGGNTITPAPAWALCLSRWWVYYVGSGCGVRTLRHSNNKEMGSGGLNEMLELLLPTGSMRRELTLAKNTNMRWVLLYYLHWNSLKRLFWHRWKESKNDQECTRCQTQRQNLTVPNYISDVSKIIIMYIKKNPNTNSNSCSRYTQHKIHVPIIYHLIYICKNDCEEVKTNPTPPPLIINYW